MSDHQHQTVKYLREISPAAWEHPADRAALLALKQLPGLDELLQKLMGTTIEKGIRLFTLASAVRVSDHQFPKLHNLFTEVCRRLDCREQPELYVAQSPLWNAGAVGVEKPFIVLYSSLLKELSDAEIMAVMGHELGHCMSGHVLYKTLLKLLVMIPASFLGDLPLVNVALRLIMAALNEWDRKSELSADRAGLLASQEPSASFNLEMKFAGGADLAQMDINEFFRQAEEYEKAGDLLDSLFKLFNVADQTHPFAVLRLTELKVWVDKGEYAKILDGSYRRREQGAAEDFFSGFERARAQYQEEMNRSRDPLLETLSGVMRNVEPVISQVQDFFQSLFPGLQPGKKPPTEEHEPEKPGPEGNA